MSDPRSGSSTDTRAELRRMVEAETESSFATPVDFLHARLTAQSIIFLAINASARLGVVTSLADLEYELDTISWVRHRLEQIRREAMASKQMARQHDFSIELGRLVFSARKIESEAIEIAPRIVERNRREWTL